jgi:hypothetical protein
VTSHFVPTHSTKTDRRSKPRLRCNYPAVVRGRGPNTTRFEEPATLCDLSATGLYLRTKREIERGTKLFVCFRMSNEPVQAPALAMRGIVVRTEARTDGTCGLGIRLLRYHIL